MSPEETLAVWRAEEGKVRERRAIRGFVAFFR